MGGIVWDAARVNSCVRRLMYDRERNDLGVPGSDGLSGQRARAQVIPIGRSRLFENQNVSQVPSNSVESLGLISCDDLERTCHLGEVRRRVFFLVGEIDDVDAKTFLPWCCPDQVWVQRGTQRQACP